MEMGEVDRTLTRWLFYWHMGRLHHSDVKLCSALPSTDDRHVKILHQNMLVLPGGFLLWSVVYVLIGNGKNDCRYENNVDR